MQFFSWFWFLFLKLRTISSWTGPEWRRNKEITVLRIQPVQLVVQFVSSLMALLVTPFSVRCCGLNQESPSLERAMGYLARMGSSTEVCAESVMVWAALVWFLLVGSSWEFDWEMLASVVWSTHRYSCAVPSDIYNSAHLPAVFIEWLLLIITHFIFFIH